MTAIPTTHQEWLDYKAMFSFMPEQIIPEDEVIRHNVDWLIGILYEPHAKVGACLDSKRLTELGLEAIGKEPINWGDLSCVEVKQYVDGGWEVEIEEADTNCPHLCAYIAYWLDKWGWKVTVRTEW